VDVWCDYKAVNALIMCVSMFGSFLYPIFIRAMINFRLAVLYVPIYQRET